MYQTYKPSGKISWIFFPLLLLFLFLIIPSVSFLYVFALYYNPSILFNIILYLLAVYLLALFGSRVCIRPGKVRNPMAAGFSGVLAGALFHYMMFASYYLFTMGESSPNKLLELAFQPISLLGAWKRMIETGFPITTLKGVQLFTLKGGFFIAAVVILLILTVCVLIVVYVDVSWFPFCETSKKWAVSKKIYLEYIEDKDLFIKKLAFGDASLLQQLEVLKGVNCNYSEAELYITDNNSDFYITIVNKRRKEGKTDKDGEAEYEGEELTDMLKLDSRTGEILLARAAIGPEQPGAKIVTQETGKSKAMVYIRMAAASCIQLGLIYFSFMKQETVRELLTNGLVWYYMLITLIIHSLSLLSCFSKEDVMVKKEEGLYFDDTKRYQIERQTAPLGYKIYHGLMAATSVLILVLCIKENM